MRHPVPLANGVDHESPHIAMVSGACQLPLDSLPTVGGREGRQPRSPHSTSKFMAMVGPGDDANRGSSSVITFGEAARATSIFGRRADGLSEEYPVPADLRPAIGELCGV